QVQHAFQISEPACVVHAAALTKPDYCEIRQQETYPVNVEGTRNVVQVCREFGAKFIHISTDFVFDGTKGNYSEEDRVHGINEYGKSKIEAERIVLTLEPTAVILRPSIMYGPENSAHPGFMDEILLRWRQGQPLEFYTDQYRSPTFAPQVGEAIERILERPDI